MRSELRNTHAEARRRKGRSVRVVLVCLLCASAPLRETLRADEPTIEAQAIRAAIVKCLPLLQQGARTFRERSEGRCIACHHQGLVLQTVALARERGFDVDEALARAEVERVHGFYARRQARYLAALNEPAAAQQADPFGNFTVHVGYWLWGLSAEKVPPDDAITTTVRLLAAKQWEDGRWSFTDTARAPMQAGDFTTTALAALALQNYAASQDKETTDRRLAAAKAWLLNTTPRTTDDKAYRLMGLKWLGAADEQVQTAAQQLLADQRPEGGWAQQENMPTDAYATGLTLVAMEQASG